MSHVTDEQTDAQRGPVTCPRLPRLRQAGGRRLMPQPLFWSPRPPPRVPQPAPFGTPGLVPSLLPSSRDTCRLGRRPCPTPPTPTPGPLWEVWTNTLQARPARTETKKPKNVTNLQIYGQLGNAGLAYFNAVSFCPVLCNHVILILSFTRVTRAVAGTVNVDAVTLPE